MGGLLREGRSVAGAMVVVVFYPEGFGGERKKGACLTRLLLFKKKFDRVLGCGLDGYWAKGKCWVV